MIDGKTYCESFKEGKLETHEILIGSNTNQEGIDTLKAIYLFQYMNLSFLDDIIQS